MINIQDAPSIDVNGDPVEVLEGSIGDPEIAAAAEFTTCHECSDGTGDMAAFMFDVERDPSNGLLEGVCPMHFWQFQREHAEDDRFTDYLWRTR